MNKTAVITGASSGIGKSFAECLAKRGYNLVLIARRKERLEHLAKVLPVQVQIFVADLTNEADISELKSFLEKIDFEIFINNAGFGDCGIFETTSLEKELSMIDLNIKALHILTKFVVAERKEKGGYLLNVASCAGLMPAGPYMSTYYATKSYVTSFTSGIAFELKKKKSPLVVSCLCPGPVNTEFNERASVEFALRGISADKCVSFALKKMFRKQEIIIPGFFLRLGIFLGKFIPRSLYVSLAAYVQRKKMLS